MSIKQSLASEKNQKIKDIENVIEDILKKKILKEVPEIKEKLSSILFDLKSTNFQDSNVKILDGEILNSEQIKEMIIEASGYTKWSVDQDEILGEQEIKDYKKNYNIDFEQTEIHNYVFYRSVNNRNDVNIIIVTAFPGLFNVDIQTGRAGYTLEGLVDKKGFVNGVSAEF